MYGKGSRQLFPTYTLRRVRRLSRRSEPPVIIFERRCVVSAVPPIQLGNDASDSDRQYGIEEVQL